MEMSDLQFLFRSFQSYVVLRRYGLGRMLWSISVRLLQSFQNRRRSSLSAYDQNIHRGWLLVSFQHTFQTIVKNPLLLLPNCIWTQLAFTQTNKSLVKVSLSYKVNAKITGRTFTRYNNQRNQAYSCGPKQTNSPPALLMTFIERNCS